MQGVIFRMKLHGKIEDEFLIHCSTIVRAGWEKNQDLLDADDAENNEGTEEATREDTG